MYLDGLGLSPEMATLIMCVTMALGAVAPPLWGMVADSIRSKYRVFILTMIGSGIVCALIPVAEWLRWGGAVGAMLLVPMTNMFLVPTQSLVDASSVSAAAAQPAMDYSNLRMWMSMGAADESAGEQLCIFGFRDLRDPAVHTAQNAQAV